jgi:hypothetical protein
MSIFEKARKVLEFDIFVTIKKIMVWSQKI